jgi:hypothetical protein
LKKAEELFSELLIECKSQLEEIGRVGKSLKNAEEDIEISSPDIIEIINRFPGTVGLGKLRELYNIYSNISNFILLEKEKLEKILRK